MKTVKFLILWFISLPAIAQDTGSPEQETASALLAEALPDHPRILLLKGEENTLMQQVRKEPAWDAVHQAIIAECDSIIGLPPLERVKIGIRLLKVSRECLRRVFQLSYAYRMTGEEKYLQRAEQELLAVSAFPDWNPSHFLDVAEMTMGVAVGYDWLSDALPEESRSTIREAIVSKGLEPSFNERHNRLLFSEHNWNQVCNAGMTFGALAVAEDEPELAGKIIDRAVEVVPKAMKPYGPDGGYPEGFTYWEYGTSFNVMLLSALEKALGTDFGLSEIPGFLKTAGFRLHMVGPLGWGHNWGDSGFRERLSPAMFWFAGRLEDPSVLWNQVGFLSEDSAANGYTANRLLPSLLIWGMDTNLKDVESPEKHLWVGQGPSPVALMRTSWEDQDAVFVGFKAGSASVNHAHMDAGSFVLDMLGERWGMDFGMQGYHSLESKGVKLWGKDQDAQRWQIFRYNNFVHNTLTIDGQLQQVKGYAKVDAWSDDPARLSLISDLTDVYKGQAASVKRGMAIVDSAYVLVRDEVKAPERDITLRWTLLTPAQARLKDDKSIELSQNGKTLQLVFDTEAEITLKAWPTDPPNDYDAPNPGTQLVGFEARIPAGSEQTFNAYFTTGSEVKPAEALGRWPVQQEAGVPGEETGARHPLRAGTAVSSETSSRETSGGALVSNGPDARDLETIRERVIEDLLEPSVDEEEMTRLMRTIRTDGSWADIDYEDVSRTGFQHSRHLSNLLDLSRAWKQPGSALYQDPELKRVISSALDFWLANDFICDNWWWNEMGTPNRMIDILLIMDGDLTENQRREGMRIAGRANLETFGARPGGDLIQIAGMLGKQALFERDQEILEEVVQVMADEIKLDTGRGLKPDLSFHHRKDRVISTLAYGTGYASSFAYWAAKTAGTGFALPKEPMELLVDYYLDGIRQSMVYGRYPDPGAKNRGITRKGALKKASAEIPRNLLEATGYRKDELEDQVKTGGTRFFWHSEYFAHQRPGYFTSVRMHSSRGKNMEYPHNEEGVKSHHYADGSNFISRTGKEYFDIFPVLDWQKIPGTTVVQKPVFPSWEDLVKDGRSDFVGGVTDGEYGAAAFDFESPHDSLRARKSWFFFDSAYVCLGAGISSGEEHPVATTLNQCLLNGEVVVKAGNRERRPRQGEHSFENVSWVFHDSIAYLFPSPAEIHLSNTTAGGDWYQINHHAWASKEPGVQKEVFTLWLDHGPQPQETGYQYVVMPGVGASDAARHEDPEQNPGIQILSNTPALQAVSHTGLNTTQIVFYEPGEIRISDELTLTAHDPCMVMLRTRGNTVEKMTLSDPTRELEEVRFEINRRTDLTGEHVKTSWNAEKACTEFSVKLPQTANAGKSVNMSRKDERILDVIRIDSVWAGHPVGFSLLTHRDRQYIAYYNANRNIVLGQRNLDEPAFDLHTLPPTRRSSSGGTSTVLGWDSHNGVTLAVDEAGYIHLAGNMHVHPLTYFRSKEPDDISEMVQIRQMIGTEEDRCTYPKFMKTRDGVLIFHYRDGGSGNGNEIYNIYSTENQTWSRLLDEPLTDGQGLMNAYQSQPVLLKDDWYHVYWVWRDTPDCSTNHDLSYIKSPDLQQWYNAMGEPVDLSVTFDDKSVIVDPIPVKGGIINLAAKLCLDDELNPVFVYHKYDEEGNLQFYTARLENDQWKYKQITDWDYRWQFEGRGSIEFEVRIKNFEKTDQGYSVSFYHKKYGDKRLILNEEFEIIDEIDNQGKETPSFELEGEFPGLLVQTTGDQGRAGSPDISYLLKWETLPNNRDRPRPKPWPAPSQLYLYKVRNSK